MYNCIIMVRASKLLPAIAAALIVILGIHQAQGQDGSSLLKPEGFRVGARVRAFRVNSTKVDHEIIIDEYYSNTERRSRLDIQLLDGTTDKITANSAKIQYYYDGSSTTGARQVIRLANNNCKLVDEKLLADDIFGEISSADQHLSGVEWLKERKDVPDYLIGFARLLVVVDANKFKLRQTEGRSMANIRNRDSTRYTMQDSLGSGLWGEKSQLTVYYGKTKNEIDGMPLRIWFIQPSGAEIIVDYYKIKKLAYDTVVTNDHESIYHGYLMFPLHRGCSSQLAKSDLLDGRRPAPKLVSFRMSIENFFDTSPTRTYFIAYDGFMGTLRRDEIDNIRDSASSTTIHDYRAKRKYNIRYGPLSPPAGSGKFNIIDTRGSQCAVTQANSNNQAEANQFEPLLPFREMVKMGYGTVRGTDVIVFEQVSPTLPAIFVSQAMESEQLFASSKSEMLYSIVYYFASPVKAAESVAKTSSSSSILRVAGENLGPLVRVKAVKRGLAQFVIDLEEFVWQLADAPTGDSSNELFSLRDACYGEGSLRQVASFATFKLELDLIAAPTLPSSDPIQEEGNRKPAADEADYTVLSNSLYRNKAVARALSGVGLPATLLYGLDTRIVHKRDNLMKIFAFGKLNYLNSQVLYEAALVGPGFWRQSTQLTNAQTFDDCFWDAMHLKKMAGEVLFTFCFSSCRLDQDVEISYGSDNSVKEIKSKGFSIYKNSILSSCKIHRLQSINPSNDTSLASSALISLKEMKKKLLVSNQLRLQMPLGDRVQELPISVKMIQIGNDRWWPELSSKATQQAAGQAGVQVLVNEGILKGVGLMLGSGATTRVQPKPSVAFAMGGGSYEDEDGSTTVMSYSLCHSSCLASMNCGSFSLCSGSGQLECLISEMEFRDPDLLASIAAQQAQAKSGPISKQITVSLQRTSTVEQAPSGDNEQGDDTVEGQRLEEQEEDAVGTSANATNIELRLDRRCQLYNKQALELFHQPAGITTTEVRSKKLMAVDSVEQCAEICLQRNMRFFKSATKRRKQTLADTSQEEGFLAKLRGLEGRNLRSWCQSFSFMNLDELDSIPSEVRDKIDSAKLTKSGLCYQSKGPIDSRPPNPSKSERRANETLALPMHRFNFIYSSLYEPQYGRRLRPSRQAHKFDLGQLKTAHEMRQFIRDENTQVAVPNDDIEICARICFLQMVDLEPWCKSFAQSQEFVKTTKGNSAPVVQSYCIFNTLSMAAALKSQMSSQLISPVPKNIAFCHYEPRNLLNLDAVILDQLLSNDDERLFSPKSNSGGLFDALSKIKYSRAGILVLLALSLVSGLALVKFIIPHLVGATNERVLARERTTSVTMPPCSNTNGTLMAKISSIVSHPNRTNMDLARLVKAGDDDNDED